MYSGDKNPAPAWRTKIATMSGIFVFSNILSNKLVRSHLPTTKILQNNYTKVRAESSTVVVQTAEDW